MTVEATSPEVSAAKSLWHAVRNRSSGGEEAAQLRAPATGAVRIMSMTNSRMGLKRSRHVTPQRGASKPFRRPVGAAGCQLRGQSWFRSR
jgi:hypothetical protein